MNSANKLISQGQGLAPALLKRAKSVTLDWDIRQKSRFECTASDDEAIGVFLPRGAVVRGGDVLVTEAGTLVRVIAANQAVLRITPCSAHGSPFDLVRAAYHLGNRHVPIELKPDHLKIEPDHVLRAMLEAMHLIVNLVDEPFEPEAGAYASAGHAHDHATEAKKVISIGTAASTHAAPHVHGPDCNHGHDHHHH